MKPRCLSAIFPLDVSSHAHQVEIDGCSAVRKECFSLEAADHFVEGLGTHFEWPKLTISHERDTFGGQAVDAGTFDAGGRSYLWFGIQTDDSVRACECVDVVDLFGGIAPASFQFTTSVAEWLDDVLGGVPIRRTLEFGAITEISVAPSGARLPGAEIMLLPENFAPAPTARQWKGMNSMMLNLSRAPLSPADQALLGKAMRSGMIPAGAPIGMSMGLFLDKVRRMLADGNHAPALRPFAAPIR